MDDRALYRERRAEAVQVTKSGEVGAILELLNSPDTTIRCYVVTEIMRQKIREAIPELLRRVSAEEASVRDSMALALAEFRAPESQETLRALMTDDSQDVRRMALRGLSRLGDEDAVDAAVAMYPQDGMMARQEALDALVELRSDASRAALQSLLAHERSWWWRLNIRRALRKHRRHS